MIYINDGKACAKQAEKILSKKIKRLRKEGITPKAVSILVGDDQQNKLYLNLKKKTAKSLGIILEIISFDPDAQISEIISTIKNINKDDEISGVMLQLPLPKKYSQEDREKISEIWHGFRVEVRCISEVTAQEE